MDPTVSVMMPVYNAEHYLDEAIRSIRGQTFSDFEFLIIDDGSTDGSLRILERHAAEDPRIRLVSRPNTGIAVVLNEMMTMARGKYLARMDADDVSLPGRFEAQVRYLDQHPECVLVGCQTVLIDPDGEIIRVNPQSISHEEIDANLLRCAVLTHPSVMMRRCAVEQVGRYRAELVPAEDLDLFLRLAEMGRLASLPETLFQYRVHPKSVGYQRREHQLERARFAIDEAHRRRGTELKHDLPQGTRESLASIYTTWAWWALRDGHLNVARKYTRKVVRMAPWSIASWRLAYCAWRGR